VGRTLRLDILENGNKLDSERESARMMHIPGLIWYTLPVRNSSLSLSVVARPKSVIAILRPSSKQRMFSGFKISVIDTERMAIFHRIEQLEEDILDETVVPKIAAAMQDLSEQIMVRSVVHDDVGKVAFLHHAVKGNHAWMRRCELMQGNFSNVDLALTWGLVP
jgi:hypothetical protein